MADLTGGGKPYKAESAFGITLASEMVIDRQRYLLAWLGEVLEMVEGEEKDRDTYEERCVVHVGWIIFKNSKKSGLLKLVRYADLCARCGLLANTRICQIFLKR